MGTEWAQKTVSLKAQSRGCHVVTKEIYKLVPEINDFDIGMCNIWRAFPTLARPSRLATDCPAQNLPGYTRHPRHHTRHSRYHSYIYWRIMLKILVLVAWCF